MKKILLVVLCLVLACAVLAGCGDGDAIKGTWRSSDEYIDAEMEAYSQAFDNATDAEIEQMRKRYDENEITFSGDGSYTGKGQFEGSGTYEIDGDSIIMSGFVATLILKDGAIYMQDNPYGDIPVFVKE